MIRIFSVLAVSLTFGGFLAWSWAAWPIRAGWIGAALIVAIAFLVRRRWRQRRLATGDDPGARERQSWHAMAGTGMVCGHLIASLATGLDLHLGSGNTLAVDNWTLLAGVGLAWLALRPRLMDRDERDREMANQGARAGFAAMTGLLITLLLTLGFAPPPVLDQLDPFMLGNVLVVVILLALLARYAAQLVGYWQASRPGPDDG